MDIRVIIQTLRRGAYIETGPYFVDGDPDTYNITARIPQGAISDVRDTMEESRFAFCAEDLSIKSISNADGFFEDIVFGVEKTFYGFAVEVSLDGATVFEGLCRFADIAFNDLAPKTVDITFYSWLKALRDESISNFEPELSGELTLDKLEDEMWGDTGALRLPWLNRNIIYDLTGLTELEMTGYALGDRDAQDKDLPFIRPVDEFRHIWQNPYNKRLYGLKYGTLTSRDRETHVSVFRLYSGREELIVSAPIVNTGERFADIDTAYFVAASSDNVGVFVEANVTGNDGRVSHRRRVISIYDRASSTRAIIETVKPGYKLWLTSSRAVTEFDHRVISDGTYAYTVEHSGRSAIITKYRLSGGSPRAIGTYTASGVYNEFAVYAPHENIIAWYDSPVGRWHWIDWTAFGDFAGTVHTGDRIPTPTTYKTGDYDYGSGTIESGLLGPIPTAYETEEFNGKYTFWCEKYTYTDSELGDFYQRFYYSNDPVFATLGSLTYDGEHSYESIIKDIALLFNAVCFVRDRTVYILSRGKFLETHNISRDIIAREKYNRVLIDHGKNEPVIKAEGGGLSDNADNPYDTSTVLGALRVLYRDVLIGRFTRRVIVLPLEVGTEINLGDKVVIVGGDYNGVVVARAMKIGNTGRMVELTLESEA